MSGSVYAFKPGSASQYPRAAFTFPPALAFAVQGLELDGVVMLLNGSSVVNVSNVDRVSVK